MKKTVNKNISGKSIKYVVTGLVCMLMLATCLMLSSCNSASNSGQASNSGSSSDSGSGSNPTGTSNSVSGNKSEGTSGNSSDNNPDGTSGDSSGNNPDGTSGNSSDNNPDGASNGASDGTSDSSTVSDSSGIYPANLSGNPFLISLGKTVVFPGELNIELNDIMTWGENNTQISLSVTTGNSEPEDILLDKYADNDAFLDTGYCGDYVFQLLSVDGEDNAVITVRKPEQRPSSKMSGAHDTYYITETNEYFEEDRFVLFVPEGIALRQDTVDMINEVMDLLEQKTGWKFFDNPLCSTISCYEPGDTRDYEYNYYWYVDPEGKKVQIAVKEDKRQVGYIPYSYENILIYHYNEKWDNGTLSVNTVAHELAHVLHAYNLPLTGDSDTFTEGFANALAYEITAELEVKYPDYYSSYLIVPNIEDNPDGSPSPITRETAQELFEHNYRIDPDENMQQRNYQIGGALNYYILKTYGAEGFKKIKSNILEKGFVVRPMTERLNDTGYIYPGIADMSDAMLEAFGPDFFCDFADWFRINKECLLRTY